MTKYIFGLLAICFCLGLSLDVGAVEQPIKTEFVQAQAPTVFCESIVEVDFACEALFTEAIAQEHPDQPGESQGNLRRSCGGSFEDATTNRPSLQIEAPFVERYRPRTDTGLGSVSAK